LINGTTFDVTANSSVSYVINRTTALGALDAAAEDGIFNYTVNDDWYASWGSLFVDSIADITSEGYNGWMYWVNYPEDPMPGVGADQFVLEDGDVVTWYWSSSMDMTPANSSKLVNITVAIEEPQETIWQGDVILINGTTFDVTANSSVSYVINRTTALGALDAAAEDGIFNYTVNDDWYASWGSLFVDSIADITSEGYNGWMYWVNYPEDPMPGVGADQFVLEDGDVVTWYWSSSMDMTPANSSILVEINVTVTSPDLIAVTIHSPPAITNDSTPLLHATFDQIAVLTWYVIDNEDAVTGGSNTDNLTVMLPELLDGQHTVTVYANNSDGNVGSATQDFLVDTTAPVINSVTLDPTDPNTGDNITVTVNATDNVGVTAVTADGVALSNADGDDIWEGTITAIEGTHTVNISASDAVANTAYDETANYTATTLTDMIAPVINSVALDPTDPNTGDNITVTVNATDNVGVTTVTADGEPLSNADGDDTWEGTITAIEGTHTVNISASDAAGNTVYDETANYTATPPPADNITPMINSVTLDPTDPNTGDNITVTVNATDNVGVTTVTADGEPLSNADGDDTWEGTITAIEGTHTVNISASDAAANTAYDETANYTATPPVPTLPVILVEDVTAAPNGYAFTSVMVKNVTGLGSGNVNVTFDPSIIQVIDVTSGDGNALTVQNWDIDNTAGLVQITAWDAQESHDGDVVFAHVTLHSVGDHLSSTPLSISSAELTNYDTYEQITHTVATGTLDTIAPVVIIDNVEAASSEFTTALIMVNNASNLGSGNITVTYNTSVVHVTNVTSGDGNALAVQGWNIDNSAGLVQILAQDGNTSHNGDVVIAIVTFHAVGEYPDSTPLAISSSELIDYTSYGIIGHSVTNGTFSIIDNEPPVITDAIATSDVILNNNGRPRVPGTNVTVLNATVLDIGSGVVNVTIDLSPIGGSDNQVMERIAGTDVWTVATTATDGINLSHELVVTATDGVNNTNTSVIGLTVLLRGDVVRDGELNSADSLYIAKYLVGKESMPSLLVSDMSPAEGDGKITSADALYLAKYLVGNEAAP